MATIGASVMGRDMFGGGTEPGGQSVEPLVGCGPALPSPGFRADAPAREPGGIRGTTFAFVTDGIVQALDQARTWQLEGTSRSPAVPKWLGSSLRIWSR